MVVLHRVSPSYLVPPVNRSSPFPYQSRLFSSRSTKMITFDNYLYPLASLRYN
ncbi:hypothetical protein LSH36_365g00026 [Paralvinella palmiformis]|uniref:Uncharacterized protein n=1 Tax=Paralvinella palmiformis TaxID=53620 RepID=A0AAD9N1B3_9ANNE|nr:hypothetical protein LSH36_365g00026 [Paralvinella palmiformis]